MSEVKTERLHLLPDNQDISPAEFARLSALMSRICDIHLSARAYVEKTLLDPGLFLPGNVWETIIKPDSFLNWSYPIANLARCASPFSGFYLMLWGRGDAWGDLGADKINALNTAFFGGTEKHKLHTMLVEEFDLVTRMDRDHDGMIGHWEALVEGVPERYRITFPPRGGEMGIRHAGRILNPDVMTHQTRVNALYGSGALEHLERVIVDKGVAQFLEIGPGGCCFSYALNQCFDGKLKVHLIDLPSVMANGSAYLSCVAGAESIALAEPDGDLTTDRAYTMIANYLLPEFEDRLPRFDLIHNAISLNEMNGPQVAYYLDFIKRKLASDGIFNLAGGNRVLDYHVDAFDASKALFSNRTIYEGDRVGSVLVGELLNSFFRL